jgi:hypothetical protein
LSRQCLPVAPSYVTLKAARSTPLASSRTAVLVVLLPVPPTKKETERAPSGLRRISAIISLIDTHGEILYGSASTTIIGYQPEEILRLNLALAVRENGATVRIGRLPAVRGNQIHLVRRLGLPRTTLNAMMRVSRGKKSMTVAERERSPSLVMGTDISVWENEGGAPIPSSNGFRHT